MFLTAPATSLMIRSMTNNPSLLSSIALTYALMKRIAVTIVATPSAANRVAGMKGIRKGRVDISPSLF